MERTKEIAMENMMKNMPNLEDGPRDLWGAGIKSVNKSEADGDEDGDEVWYGDEYVEEEGIEKKT